MVDRSASRARRWLGAIRVRTTAAAVLVVGVSLATAAVAMVALLQRSLLGHVRTTALARAELIALDLTRTERSGRIAVDEEEDEFVQVLDGEGRVVLASANVAGRAALVRLSPGQTRILPGVPFEEGPFMAAAELAVGGNGPLTVVVGRSLETIAEARRAVIGTLSVAVPFLIAVVGLVTWRVVGRALAPVETMRAEVEAISARRLHRRVPVPGSRDEVARLAETMNRMLERLETSQQRQRRFVSDASHELRSPIAAIRQHAEVALSHPGGTDPRELAEVVLEEDLRLERIVEDLLFLARMDEGTLHIRPTPVDLDDLLFEEAARLRGTTALRVDVGGVSAGRVAGDRGRLERLLRNLTDNAARHARSMIALSLQEDDGEVVLRVDDDGEGIGPVHRERVFERFVRLEEARDRDSGGSGLGLAIVKEIAILHRGTVSALDSPLGGARIEVRLPSAPS